MRSWKASRAWLQALKRSPKGGSASIGARLGAKASTAPRCTGKMKAEGFEGLEADRRARSVKRQFMVKV